MARLLGDQTFEYVEIDHLPPLYVSKNSPTVKTLMEIYGRYTGDIMSEPMVIGGGTYARVLPNTVSFGPVFPGQEELAHQANEYIEEKDLLRLVCIYEEAMKALADL